MRIKRSVSALQRVRIHITELSVLRYSILNELFVVLPSVLDPYSSNLDPDPAKYLKPDADPGRP